MMKRIGLHLFAVVILGFLIWAVQNDGLLEKGPPFHAGGRLFPNPVPSPAPPESFLADNPMALLAKPKNFSASRVSSYDRTGANLDMYVIPPTGEEFVLADIKGPGWRQILCGQLFMGLAVITC